MLDEASEKLSAIRGQRQANLKSLRLAMEEWARDMHRKGAAERSQVTCTSKPGSSQSVGTPALWGSARSLQGPSGRPWRLSRAPQREAAAGHSQMQSVRRSRVLVVLASSSSHKAEQRCLARASSMPYRGVGCDAQS